MNENLNGVIFITPKNKMSGRVRIKGIRKEDLVGEIKIKRFEEISSNVNVYSDQIIITPSYPPILGNQKKSSLSISHRKDLTGNIFIPPKNKMSGRVESIEPPTYFIELETEKDSFVRDQIPTLNYGDAQSMVVGKNLKYNEIYRSLIKFDTTQIPNNSKIESVKLKIFNKQLNATTHQVGIYSISDEWQEYGVTWANQPALKDLITIVDLGEIGYTDIDVTEVVKEWYQNPQENNGFLIKAINEENGQTEQFSTKESPDNKPYLNVEYKLDIIYSVGRSNIDSSIFIYAYGESSLPSSINIPSFDEERNIRSNIHIRNFNLMLEANLDVNKPDVPSSLVVKRYENNQLPSDITIRIKGGFLPDDNLNSNIFISKPVIYGEIRVKTFENIPSLINIRKLISDEDILNGSVTINKPTLKSSLTVKQFDSNELNGFIRLRFKDELHSSLNINTPFLHGKIIITHYHNLNGSIKVRQAESISSNITIPYRNNIPSNIFITHADHMTGSIHVLSGYLRSNIIIPYRGDSSKMSSITVKVRDIKEISGLINIGGDNILAGYIYFF